MSEYDGTILFKEWLPDQPELNNPGLLEAQNVLPIDAHYQSFATLATSGAGTALASRPNGAFAFNSAGGQEHYVGTENNLFRYTAAGAWVTVGSVALGTSSNNYWRFVQYEANVYFTNYSDNPRYVAVGTSTTTTALVGAPKARQIGRIGQFIVLGDTVDTANGAVVYRAQWSGIDQPTSWPAANSATAVAQQAGEQYFDPVGRAITSIVSGDQWGLFFQESIITRATYVGGSTVFQFDQISHNVGALYPNAVVPYGNLVFFIASSGFYLTDGVAVKPIGVGVVDKYFLARVSPTYPERVYGALDHARKLIYWNFPLVASGTGQPTDLIIYNIERNRFSRATLTCESLTTGTPTLLGDQMVAFSAGHIRSSFTGAPGTAVVTTGEMEPNPAGFASYQGVKPLVDVTLNAVTVAMGTRNNRTDAVTYSSETTANSRTGFANFRTEAKYHRMRLTIAGTFNAAQGAEYQAEAGGYT